MIEPFVDADAAARFLAITRRQVLQLARSGKIPAHPLSGGRRKVWRFKLSEVDAAVVLDTNEDKALARNCIPRKIHPAVHAARRENSNG